MSKLLRCYKHLKTQFFACLLVFLAGRPCFYLMVGLVSLIVGLAISEAELMGREIAAGFCECFLWNKLINFRKCCIVEAGS